MITSGSVSLTKIVSTWARMSDVSAPKPAGSSLCTFSSPNTAFCRT